jgi:hypothetical protein
MANTVSHPSDADSRSAFVDGSEFFGSDSSAVIFDFEGHSAIMPADSDFGDITAGVPQDIAQTLLYYAEHRQFSLSGKSAAIFGNAEVNLQGSSLIQPVDVPAKRRRDTALIQ